jgi:hypothetical protein
MVKMNMDKMNMNKKININPGKKCIPGLFCVGNMTLFMFCIMSLIIVYLLYRQNGSNVIVITQPPSPLPASSSSLGNNNINNENNDPLSNAYLPPLRNNNNFIKPKPIPTQSFDTNYQQMGILTRNNSNHHNEILPLMGKRKMTSRYKWQYYTISSGHGNLQTKLPVSVKGKSCTGEYGCDEIYNNDSVYVEGFKDVFVATIYENNTFEYIP